MQIMVKNTSSRTKALRTGPGTRAILKVGEEALLDFDDGFLTKAQVDALASTGLLFYCKAEDPVEEEESAPATKPPAKAAAKTPAAAPKASSQAAGKTPADPTPAPAPEAPAAAAPAADATEVPKAAPWQRGLEAPK